MLGSVSELALGLRRKYDPSHLLILWAGIFGACGSAYLVAATLAAHAVPASRKTSHDGEGIKTNTATGGGVLGLQSIVYKHLDTRHTGHTQ